jgi:G patch domain/KOW motif-containing protein
MERGGPGDDEPPPAGEQTAGAAGAPPPPPKQPLAFGLAAAPALNQKRRLAAPIRGLTGGDDPAGGGSSTAGQGAQLITAIDASGRVVAAADGNGDGSNNAATKKGPLVIPALANTYRGPAGAAAARAAGNGGKFVPSFVPPSSAAADGEDKFVAAAVPTEEEQRRAAASTRYGLELRGGAVSAAGGAGGGAGTTTTTAAAAAAAAAPPSLPERQRLEEDLKALPEPAPREAYEALPVEEFGKALLRGLGWREGEGVGRKRQKVETKEPVRRPERLGLGADPSAAIAAAQAAQAGRPLKMGDKRPAEPVVAAAAGGGGGGGGERREERRREEERRGEERRSGGGGGGSQHRHDRDRDRRHDRHHDRDRHHHHRSSSHRRRSRSRSPPAPPPPPARCWLLPGIRVRVVDRRLDAGRAYRLKGSVLEVHPGPCADVALDPLESSSSRPRVLSLVPQAALETVVPKAVGGRVVVLRGERRGERATLLDARHESGVAAVQLADDLSVLRLSLDDFAEEAAGAGGRG